MVGVDHSSYLTSHRKQKSPKEESHGHKIREAGREIQTALLRSRQVRSKEDDKDRQAALHGIPGKSSKRGRQQRKPRLSRPSAKVPRGHVLAD